MIELLIATLLGILVLVLAKYCNDSLVIGYGMIIGTFCLTAYLHQPLFMLIIYFIAISMSFAIFTIFQNIALLFFNKKKP